MFRLFLSFQACLLLTALAQPINARDSLIYPTNPPKPASPQEGSASALQTPKSTAAPSVLTIGELDIAETATGAKELKATFVHGGAEQLNPADTRVVVYFYNTDAAGNLTLSDSEIETKWVSPPVDWRERSSHSAQHGAFGRFEKEIRRLHSRDLLQGPASG